MPILHLPGLIIPGQFGPINRVCLSRKYSFTFTMSSVGMPSVMQTTTGTPASAAWQGQADKRASAECPDDDPRDSSFQQLNSRSGRDSNLQQAQPNQNLLIPKADESPAAPWFPQNAARSAIRVGPPARCRATRSRDARNVPPLPGWHPTNQKL